MVSLLRVPASAVSDLPQSYKEISNEDEVKKRGYKAGGKGKLLEFDVVMSTVEENEGARQRFGEAQKR